MISSGGGGGSDNGGKQKQLCSGGQKDAYHLNNSEEEGEERNDNDDDDDNEDAVESLDRLTELKGMTAAARSTFLLRHPRQTQKNCLASQDDINGDNGSNCDNKDKIPNSGKVTRAITCSKFMPKLFAGSKF